MVKNVVVSFSVFILVSLFTSVYSQDQQQTATPPPVPHSNTPAPPSPFQKDKFFFGGGLGAQFGSMTLINISPLVGYKITDRLQVGLRATYMYYSYNVPPYKVQTSIYGGGFFSRLFIFENIFLHAEYELLNMDSYDFPGTRSYVENYLVGGGFRQRIGDRASYMITALWNLNPSKYSPYANPIIRMGFTFGF